jgi:hypothetical protein
MMVNLTFSDEIVNATDLRNNQKYWLDAASRKPVTVAYGKHNLAILSRQQIAELYKQNYYLGIVLRLCSGVNDLPELPWVKILDDDDRAEFIDEFTSAMNKALSSNNWHDIEILLEDWKATAETLNNKITMKALINKQRKDRYIPLQ